MDQARCGSIYPGISYEVGHGYAVLQPERLSDKTVKLRPRLPGNIIIVHGVNDVGVYYESVEQGLCAGLGTRLQRKFTPGTYRMPQPEGRGKLFDDPDAIFYKRRIDAATNSPVIPFYWGFREAEGKFKTKNGQFTDRHGNRLDKDLAKNGGPFANATNTLPDMWNRGFGALPFNPEDKAMRDALRPINRAPGRLYMVLAAKRLAALIAMIRDYHEHDTVSIVAHSQGCLLSLLAQAFLLEQGLRPADTLILTHPPYSLADEASFLVAASESLKGDADDAMKNGYSHLDSRQTLHARLQTLVNLVNGVAGRRHAEPAFATLADSNVHQGIVGAHWRAEADRDNRGKVYLYFCPEDMTVALNNMQGIGWQGVPETVSGKRYSAQDKQPGTPAQILPGGIRVPRLAQQQIGRQPLAELGKGFLQRVFTARQRPDAGGKPAPVLVGQAPQDFVLRLTGEDDQAHVEPGAFPMRAHLPEEHAPARAGIRRITGEPLPAPAQPDLYGNALHLPNQPRGAHEAVDAIEAAIAVTSNYGIQVVWQRMPDPTDGAPFKWVGNSWGRNRLVVESPHPATYRGKVVGMPSQQEAAAAQARLNEGKSSAQRCEVLRVYACVAQEGFDLRYRGELLVMRRESVEEAQLRWQRATSARSFHGAIFGGRANHEKVTAHDVAIGSGRASSNPHFYAYLCAVADWRLKKPQKNEKPRPSILTWEKFTTKFNAYWQAEP